jgi:RNA polymerase sigma-70 factor (ECF subfamily)
VAVDGLPVAEAEDETAGMGSDNAAKGPGTFDDVYRSYAHPLYRYFFQHVRNPAEAEDLTATAFTRLLAGWARYEEDGRPAAVLFTIARNLLVDYWRRQRRHVDVDALGGSLVDPQPQPEAEALRAERERQVRRLIAQLPEDQREALLARFFGGLSIADTARSLGRSEGSVKMLLQRGLARLGREYRKEGRA